MLLYLFSATINNYALTACVLQDNMGSVEVYHWDENYEYICFPTSQRDSFLSFYIDNKED